MITQYLSRLFPTRNGHVLKVLALAATFCALMAIIFFLSYSETTETTGHLWWKETQEVPFGERRPYLLAGIGFALAALLLVLSAVSVFAAQWRWERSPAAEAERKAKAAEAEWHWRMDRAERAEREAAEARRHWEESTAGRATLAHQRGDQYFSVELVADESLARHLNDVFAAGWVQESVGRRHERTTSHRPLYDGTHETTRESVEIRTYLFRRTR